MIVSRGPRLEGGWSARVGRPSAIRPWPRELHDGRRDGCRRRERRPRGHRGPRRPREAAASGPPQGRVAAAGAAGAAALAWPAVPPGPRRAGSRPAAGPRLAERQLQRQLQGNRCLPAAAADALRQCAPPSEGSAHRERGPRRPRVRGCRRL